MLAAEKCLLLAVRERLRQECGYTDRQCEIEYDEQAPAITGDLYVIVMGGGWTAGPRHHTCEQINDLVYAVDVTVLQRATSVPRDRKRSLYFERFTALTEEIDKIYQAIDWNYPTIMTNANAKIESLTGSTYGFIDPLRFFSIERRPRLVPGDMFDSREEHAAALARTISFGGARRITVK